MPAIGTAIARAAAWVMRKGTTAIMRRVGIYRAFMAVTQPGSILPSGRSILRMLRQKGIGIATGDFYRLMKNFRGIGQKLEAQLRAPSNRRVKVDVMPDYPGALSSPYQYRFTLPVAYGYQIREGDVEGQMNVHEFAMKSSDLWTPETAATKFLDKFGPLFAEHGADLEAIEFHGVYRR